MKISKLFHWLYAILMLLPAFAIGVTCAYAIFNKNAYQSYSGEISSTFEEQNVTSFNDLVVGNKYRYTSQNVVTTTNLSKRILISNVELISSNASASFNNDLLNNATAFTTNASKYIILFNEDTTINSYDIANFTIVFDFICDGYSNPTSIQYVDAFDGMITKIIYNDNFYIDNVFYYSIDKVQQSTLFNWAYDSFLATPITYITGLFGMASDHIAVMLMSYWLAISVIWLVFDMVMYVPLLVHRWIDKGVLE